MHCVFLYPIVLGRRGMNQGQGEFISDQVVSRQPRCQTLQSHVIVVGQIEMWAITIGDRFPVLLGHQVHVYV
jgi:hypothetical protein